MTGDMCGSHQGARAEVAMKDTTMQPQPLNDNSAQGGGKQATSNAAASASDWRFMPLTAFTEAPRSMLMPASAGTSPIMRVRAVVRKAAAQHFIVWAGSFEAHRIDRWPSRGRRAASTRVSQAPCGAVIISQAPQNASAAIDGCIGRPRKAASMAMKFDIV